MKEFTFPILLLVLVFSKSVCALHSPLGIGPCVAHKLSLPPSLMECINLARYLEEELHTSPASEMRGATVVLLALLTRALNPCCRSVSLEDAERQNEHRGVKVSRASVTSHEPMTCDGWV